MSRSASYYVAAQERYCCAMERVLEATTEALEHVRKCASCRVLGHKCQTAESIDKRIATASKVMQIEKVNMETDKTANKRMFNFVQHVAEDVNSPYHEYASKVLNDIKEVPYGNRVGRKNPSGKVGK